MMKVRDGAPNISCKRRPAKSEKMNHAHIYILCAPWFIINQDCTVERITVSYLEARRTRGGQTSHERGRRASTRYRLASMEGDEVARAGSTYERSAAMMAWLAERPTLAERTRNRPIIVPRVRTENRGATFDRLGKPWRTSPVIAIYIIEGLPTLGNCNRKRSSYTNYAQLHCAKLI